MLREIFYWLFNMSVAGALSGAVVLLLRLVKKIPRRVIAVLWAIPFLRMWIPVGIGGKFGLMTLLSRFTTKTVTVYESRLLPDFSFTNSICAADSYFPITFPIASGNKKAQLMLLRASNPLWMMEEACSRWT